jgi:membrane-associated phospholipid phosphatase
VKYAQRFLLSNFVAFAIGFPLFSLVPAVGPWYAYNTTPSPAQALCQSSFLHLRNAASYTAASAGGLVCFPSYHVIFAILCAAALWTYKPLRVPVAMLCGLIVLSTMTTGWHYFSDVLAGIAVSFVSLFVANKLLRVGDGLAEVLPTNRAAGPFRIDLTATRSWGSSQTWTDNTARPTPPHPRRAHHS